MAHIPWWIRYTRRSPDTDVFIILLRFVCHINHTVLFDTGTGDNRRLVNVQAVAKDLGDETNLALIALQAFTGCDTTSAFVRRGKVKPLTFLKKKLPEFLSAFHALGSRVDIEDRVFKDLQKFMSDLRKQVGWKQKIYWEIQCKARKGNDKLQRCWHEPSSTLSRVSENLCKKSKLSSAQVEESWSGSTKYPGTRQALLKN